MIDREIFHNTRDQVIRRKEICHQCEYFEYEICKKWDLKSGKREPWTGINGVCPILRWTLGRAK